MTQARIIVDLSYGDAGKGTTIDYFARSNPSSVVVRYNGGPQAAHNVITPDGRHHTFSQFGSGSFVAGVPTHLSRDMLVNPMNMYPEAQHLMELGVHDIWERVTVDRQARIITPWHVAVNRLREYARGMSRHGSCAQGIGEVMADDIARPDLTLRADDTSSMHLRRKLERIRQYKCVQAEKEFPQAAGSEEWQLLHDADSSSVVAEAYREWTGLVRLVESDYLAYLAATYDQLLFEGAQGVLLDEWRGFHPYTTWSTTTPANALSQLDEIGFDGEIETLGIVRAYTTRHGPGPFVTEDAALADSLREYHNDYGVWQGSFRYGHFDAVAHRYAIASAGRVDKLVITGLDRAAELPAWQYCNGYSVDAQQEEFFLFDDKGVACDMRLGPYEDLMYQQQLGEALQSVAPLYAIHGSVTKEEIASTIERLLAIPIGLTSFGPTAADKQLYVCV